MVHTKKHELIRGSSSFPMRGSYQRNLDDGYLWGCEPWNVCN